MRLFGIHSSSSSGTRGNSSNHRDVAAVEAIHTQTTQALFEGTQAAATVRPPLQVEAYASALSQGARALSASGHTAAMAAVLVGGDVVVKIPKKKSSAATTTTTTTTAVAASSSGVAPLFCPIPVKARVVVAASAQQDSNRKKKRVVVQQRR